MIVLEGVSKRFKSKEKKYIGKYFLRNILKKIVAVIKNEDTDDGEYVLKDISFTIAQGEHVGIIGRNKSGKTTLLQILCGITEPYSGKVLVDGNLIPVFAQGNVLGPDLTGREYIFLHGTALGIPVKVIEPLLQDIIDFSEITTIDTPVKFYSTGMRSRLAISVALHLPADIYVLDEVFSGSDVFFKEKLTAFLQDKLKNSNKTLIIVSHIEENLRNFCERMILIQDGKIIMDGNVDEVMNCYNSNNPAALQSIP